MTQKTALKAHYPVSTYIIIRLFTLTTLYNRVVSRAKEERGARGWPSFKIRSEKQINKRFYFFFDNFSYYVHVKKINFKS